MEEHAELLHDLRMPVQLMYSCAQLLEDEIGANERARGYVRMLMGSAVQMQRMLVGALDGAACGQGEMVELIGLTWETCARCRLYARRKDIELSFHANADRLMVEMDEEKYTRILLNLLSNALKFTPEGGRVRVMATVGDEWAEICVEDDGCGIEAERINAIFELHETDGGYGYGLYIARAYADQMGGSLTVKSEPGAGSACTLRLPVGTGARRIHAVCAE